MSRNTRLKARSKDSRKASPSGAFANASRAASQARSKSCTKSLGITPQTMLPGGALCGGKQVSLNWSIDFLTVLQTTRFDAKRMSEPASKILIEVRCSGPCLNSAHRTWVVQVKGVFSESVEVPVEKEIHFLVIAASRNAQMGKCLNGRTCEIHDTKPGGDPGLPNATLAGMACEHQAESMAEPCDSTGVAQQTQSICIPPRENRKFHTLDDHHDAPMQLERIVAAYQTARRLGGGTIKLAIFTAGRDGARAIRNSTGSRHRCHRKRVKPPHQRTRRPRLLAAFVVWLIVPSYSAAISSASPSWRMSSSSRSASSKAAVTSCCTRAAASSSSCESWMLR